MRSSFCNYKGCFMFLNYFIFRGSVHSVSVYCRSASREARPEGLRKWIPLPSPRSYDRPLCEMIIGSRHSPQEQVTSALWTRLHKTTANNLKRFSKHFVKNKNYCLKCDKQGGGNIVLKLEEGEQSYLLI